MAKKEDVTYKSQLFYGCKLQNRCKYHVFFLEVIRLIIGGSDDAVIGREVRDIIRKKYMNALFIENNDESVAPLNTQ